MMFGEVCSEPDLALNLTNFDLVELPHAGVPRALARIRVGAAR